MKKTTIVALAILVLCAATVLAADVTTKESGYTKSSTAYIFTYDPADTSITLIDGIKAGDVIRIMHPNPSDPVNSLKTDIYLKTRLPEKFLYDIKSRVYGAEIILGGDPKPIDVEGDGTDDLLLEYISFNATKATFTITPMAKEITDSVEKEQAPATTEEKNETTVAPAPSENGATPPSTPGTPTVEQENEEPEKEPGQRTETTTTQGSDQASQGEKTEADGNGLLILIVVIVVLAIIGGIIAVVLKKKSDTKQEV